jgi:hypothetical protein
VSLITHRIYARLTDVPPLGLRGRLTAALTAGTCFVVLAIAAVLPPNSSGMGTHRELGLEECSFLLRTGLPCPSCGMTTSFSWFMHGNWLASFYVQPFGMALALATLIRVWAALYTAFTGKPVHQLLHLLNWRKWTMPIVLFGILAWGWKIALHLSGHDGW